MNKQPHICVVGSINMDLVTKIDRMPDQGETVLGGKFETHPGGKGANQAVAAARLGSKVTMIGAVGNDSFGEKMLTHLDEEKVVKEAVHVDANKSTGIASIIVSENDNRIIVSSGANEAVTPELVEHLKEEILASDMVLLQFEIPMETIVYTVDLSYDNQIPIILNPAPYQDIPEETLAKSTYITPNEIEYDAMKSLDSFEAIKNKMIITKGKQGIEFIDATGKKKSMPAYDVKVKDTTGAGDTFNGALATALASNEEIDQAVKFANVAAALSVEKFGAQGGMPSKQEVDAFISRQKH